jgi:hypothetical protein
MRLRNIVLKTHTFEFVRWGWGRSRAAGGQATKAAAGDLEPHKEFYQSAVNEDDRTCTIENV